jgi:hypothetical protein
MLCETTISYRADISAGALKVPESRAIAGLLRRGVDEKGWKLALISGGIRSCGCLPHHRRKPAIAAD